MKKKFLVGLLAVVMCLTLVGCGKSEDKEPTNNGSSTNSQSGNNGSSQEQKNYTFPGYTNEGTWPDKEAWADMGLPELNVADAGNVEISSKSYIYPLNAQDAVMFDCNPGSSHYNDIISTLNEAGITGSIESDDSYEKEYVANYTKGSDPMRITVTEYGGSHLIILVEYKPNN